ncbi:G-protein coupled receptor family C group 5 member C-like [Protopterus annectens]|uniref:G-protein coupled receptor family C group 5 member C-like n=1 Tax=Protopterus annectens TaxID=7888 RepID=UPI001CFC2EF7|nr:G-protein coupled receptor family C group 5 member C-like [Protopterus annectens]
MSEVPNGCGPELNPIYFNLCSLYGVWGIVLQAIAVAGIIGTILIALVFMGLLPFMPKDMRRGALGVNFMFLMGVLGLFSLIFAFVVQNFTPNCSVRRFLFGVLFAVCFSCLVSNGVRLNYLVRHNYGPKGWVTALVAIALILVEVVINVEWLLITNVRHNPLGADPSGDPCNYANQDFVSALVYVMFLMFAALVVNCFALFGDFHQWRRHSIFIVVTVSLSMAIWIVWIVMYTYGNRQVGNPLTWDDPALAIALASNAWVFLFFYSIPQLVEAMRADYDISHPVENVQIQMPRYTTLENRAFSMEETLTGNGKSPYMKYDRQESNQSNSVIYSTISWNSRGRTMNGHLPAINEQSWKSEL